MYFEVHYWRQVLPCPSQNIVNAFAVAESLHNKELPISEVFTQANPLHCLLRALSV